MAEREIVKSKEAEAREVHYYEDIVKDYAAKRERANSGAIVVRGAGLPWEQCRQGRIKHWLHPNITSTALGGWSLFLHDIRTHSGLHRHQGGLCLFVVEGKGWTVVDGKRYDWEEGDLILLPVQPQGCSHQHFNAEPGTPCKWLAMIYEHYMDVLGNEMEQKVLSPDWANKI